MFGREVLIIYWGRKGEKFAVEVWTVVVLV